MPAVAVPGTAARDRSWLRFGLAGSAILLAVGAGQIAWGERIPVGRGAGWDGREYARIARELPEQLASGKLDRYRLRRILPSALAHATLAVLDRPATIGRIAHVFAWWNVVFLLATCWAWAAITDTLAIGPGRWLGFLLLFVNFANLKMPFYYPILTDSAALCLGALLVLFHLRDQAGAMWVTLVLAAFTWPALALFGASLFVFRPGPSEAPADAGGRRLTAAAVAVAYVASVWLLREGLPPMAPLRLAAALALAALYVFAVTFALFPPPSAWPRLFARHVAWRRLLLLGATLVLVERLVATWAQPTVFSPGFFLYLLLMLSVAEPGLFLVAHPVYLGLVVPLLALGWGRAVASAHALGPGVTLFLWAHLAWALHPESRVLVSGLTLAVLLVTMAQGPRPWPKEALIVTGALALVVSKVWLPINRRVEYGEHIHVPWYFMNHGPYMTREDYAWQAAAVVVVTALVALLLRAARRARADPGRLA